VKKRRKTWSTSLTSRGLPTKTIKKGAGPLSKIVYITSRIVGPFARNKSSSLRVSTYSNKERGFCLQWFFDSMLIWLGFSLEKNIFTTYMSVMWVLRATYWLAVPHAESLKL
jgi:hypothetical protein